ncbi:MAG TPA: sigma 54-interacting transcriptional regulator [Acidobacteriaceae bacterium]|nr:sigma 54-interacting transcriptional regulator [Acidobacteriaceae bacterium]
MIAEGDQIVHRNELFEKLFEFSPDGILVASRDGRILQANPHAEKIFGFPSGTMAGTTIESLVPERLRSAHSQHRDDYQEAPRARPMAANLELYGQRHDGSEFPADIMLSPVHVGGELLVLAVVRDITERKKMEEDLRHSEEKFRLLIEGAQDYAIFMLDTEGRIASWNPGAERIKGYTSEEILGQHFSIFYLQEDLERGKPENELRVAKSQGRYEEEGWRVRKDGSRFWANVIIAALRDKDGNLIGFSKVTRDFTDRKRAEEALVVELSRAMLSDLDIRKMLGAIEAGIQQVAPHDYAAISLYDSELDRLRVHELTPHRNPKYHQEILINLENSPSGDVFTRHEPMFWENARPEEYPPERFARYGEEELKSGCWLPLDSHNHVIGTLFIGSRHVASFAPKDAEMLLRIAHQIALAIDNVQAAQQISNLTAKLREEKQYLEEELRTEYSFEEIVGESQGLKRVLKQVEIVAPTDATALVLGDTGTGKELIARAIHNLSPRRERTFVKLNCSAIPLGLLESELFGHEKGAFTGAVTQRIGRLELAHMGTLFLDEIGDLPLELQPKLLRALQEREIERLGGRRTIPVNVRLIAATNRDLARMVKEGLFRSDLYYRLKVFPIAIPSLQERSEDIPLLVNYFVNKHARRMNKQITTIPREVMNALIRWPWPGNVRELENFLERAVILTNGSALRAPLGEMEAAEVRDSSPVYDLRSNEREHILRALRETKGNIGGLGGAAEKLGLKRTTLNSKIKKLGIEKSEYA